MKSWKAHVLAALSLVVFIGVFLMLESGPAILITVTFIGIILIILYMALYDSFRGQ